MKTGSNITYWSMVTFIVFILGSLCLLSAALTKIGKHKVNTESSCLKFQKNQKDTFGKLRKYFYWYNT